MFADKQAIIISPKDVVSFVNNKRCLEKVAYGSNVMEDVCSVGSYLVTIDV